MFYRSLYPQRPITKKYPLSSEKCPENDKEEKRNPRVRLEGEVVSGGGRSLLGHTAWAVCFVRLVL